MDQAFVLILLVVAIELTELLLDTDVLTLLLTSVNKCGIEFEVYIKHLIGDWTLFLWL